MPLYIFALPGSPSRGYVAAGELGGDVVAGVACLLLAIVLTIVHRWTSQGERVRVNFVTEPFEATIELDGVPLLKPDGTPYTTPCTVPDVPVGVHRIIFKREPLNDLDIGRIDFRERRDIEARWNPEPER